MKKLLSLLLIGFTVCIRTDGQTNAVPAIVVPKPTVETLVCIRMVKNRAAGWAN